MMSLLLVVAAVLTSIAQQEASPPAPSVAEAARAARERQKSTNAKHVLTDEDFGGSQETGGSGSPASEAEARSQLERDPSVPAKPTVADLKQRIHDFSVASGRDQPTQDFRHGGLYELFQYKNVDFPGRKEWEEEMTTAVNHSLAESGLAAARLQAILDENQEALSRGDPPASQRVRKQMIDALVPNVRWQMRLSQLWQEGQARAKAYLSNSAAASNDYRQSQGKRAGTIIGYTLIDLSEKEAQFKRAHGRYTCDLSEFNFFIRNQSQLKSSDVGWQTKMGRCTSWGIKSLCKAATPTIIQPWQRRLRPMEARGGLFAPVSRGEFASPKTAGPSIACRRAVTGMANKRSPFRWAGCVDECPQDASGCHGFACARVDSFPLTYPSHHSPVLFSRGPATSKRGHSPTRPREVVIFT